MIEYQPACRYAVTATMNIARNTSDIPINGIFANKSTRAMRPTSIDRMTVVTVNTFRRCGARRMEPLAIQLNRRRDYPRIFVTWSQIKAHYGPMNAGPQTQVVEIATDIYRLSTFVADVPPKGFTFNQFLLTGDEPFLFHCGHRQLFPSVSEAINRV